MEFRSLEYFISAYELKSFTKAAKELYLTQQGISKAIAQLENEFGAALFIREKTQLLPTKFGKTFYEHSKKLIDEYHRTEDILKAEAHKASKLRIGFAANIMSVLNAENLIIEFQQKFPATKLEIMSLTDYECEDALLKHLIDVAFSMGPFSASDITPVLLKSESICALVPATHPLSNREFLTIQDLSNEPLIVTDSRNKGYANALSYFQKNCKKSNIIFQTSDPVTHLRMVSKQMGISLFPNHLKSIFEKSPDVQILPIVDMPHRNIYLISEPQAQKLEYVQQFIKFTQRFFNDVNQLN